MSFKQIEKVIKNCLPEKEFKFLLKNLLNLSNASYMIGREDYKVEVKQVINNFWNKRKQTTDKIMWQIKFKEELIKELNKVKE